MCYNEPDIIILTGGNTVRIEKYRFDGDSPFDIGRFDPSDTGDYKAKDDLADITDENLRQTEKLQDKLYAEGKNGLLIIFQAMDAAGKDGAVKHVFSGINPQGVDIYNFKQPSAEELSHDYLWRASRNLPARGRIAIFNRSYYEDVLIGRVHKLYEQQKLPKRCQTDDVIRKRYGQIRDYESYLWENGITVVKFFLNISKEEQRKRLLERIDDKSKNWKFSKDDLHEREYWAAYQDAYEKAINETATKKCPWYVLPSDSKWYARALISEIILRTLGEIDPQYPELPKEARDELDACRKALLK